MRKNYRRINNILRKIIVDKNILIVTITEKIVVEEGKRSYMYLNLYNFNVDTLYINRIIPQDIENSFFDKWKQLQNDYLDEQNSVFGSIPTYKIKWYEVDINGIDGLDRIADDSLTDEHLFEVLKTTPNEIFEKIENGYRLEIYIPFANKTDFDLLESGTDIIIKIGNQVTLEGNTVKVGDTAPNFVLIDNGLN